MPLYIQNEDEVMAQIGQDDYFPSTNPSIGSITSSEVLASGNRVLELLEKHRKAIQARMTDREKSVKSMLQSDSRLSNFEKRNNNDRTRSPSRDSPAAGYPKEAYASSSTTRGSNTLRESYVQAYLNARRMEESNMNGAEDGKHGPESRYRPLSIYSDEYLNPPGSAPEPKKQNVSPFRMEDDTAGYTGLTDLIPRRELAYQTVERTRSRSRSNERQGVATKDSGRFIFQGERETVERTRSRSRSNERQGAATKDSGRFIFQGERERSSNSRNFQVPNVNPIAGEDCTFAPEEDQESKADSDSDEDGLDLVAQSNRVTFNSEVMYKPLPSTGENPRNSFGRWTTLNNHDEGDDHGEVENNNRTANSSGLGGRTNVSVNGENTQGGGLEDDFPPWSAVRDRGAKQGTRESNRNLPRTSSSRSSSAPNNEGPNSTGAGEKVKAYLKGIYEYCGNHVWQLCVIIGIIALLIGIALWTMNYTRNSSFSGGPYTIRPTGGKPKVTKYYGPVM